MALQVTTRGRKAVFPEGMCYMAVAGGQSRGRDMQAQERGLWLWPTGVWSEVTKSPFSGFSLNSALHSAFFLFIVIVF